MTGSAQLSNRPATCGGRVVPRAATPRRPPARGRSLAARPTATPALRRRGVGRRGVACPARLAPAVAGAGRAPPVALRSGLVASLVAAATVMLAIGGGLDRTGPQAPPAIPADMAATRVGAGETIWDVARRVAPRSDQRAVAQRIRQLNGMVESAVVPGQQLLVPDGHSPHLDARDNGYPGPSG